MITLVECCRPKLSASSTGNKALAEFHTQLAAISAEGGRSARKFS